MEIEDIGSLRDKEDKLIQLFASGKIEDKKLIKCLEKRIELRKKFIKDIKAKNSKKLKYVHSD